MSNREQYLALREAQTIAVTDAYFAARPHLDTAEIRKAFADGYARGYDKAYEGVASEPPPNLIAAMKIKASGGACSQQLAAAGLSYPRTCRKCGLGPCTTAREAIIKTQLDPRTIGAVPPPVETRYTVDTAPASIFQHKLECMCPDCANWKNQTGRG